MVRALSIVAFLAGASAVSALRPVAGISPVMIFKRDSGALEARQQLEPCGGGRFAIHTAMLYYILKTV